MSSMIKTYYYNHPKQKMEHDIDLSRLPDLLRSNESLLWIDLFDVGNDELYEIARLFDFHPLAIEDCLHVSSRAKVDRYDRYDFFVVHALRYNEESETEVSTVELNVFMGSNYLVTIHKNRMTVIGRVAEVCLKSAEYTQRGSDYLFYSIIDGITDEYFPIMDRLGVRIDELQEKMFRTAVEKVTKEFLTLNRTLVLIQRVILPQQRIFSPRQGKFLFPVQEENVPYYLDLVDHQERLSDTSATYRDLMDNALKTYNTYLSGKETEMMRQLTVTSAILIPLIMIAALLLGIW